MKRDAAQPSSTRAAEAANRGAWWTCWIRLNHEPAWLAVALAATGFAAWPILGDPRIAERFWPSEREPINAAPVVSQPAHGSPGRADSVLAFPDSASGPAGEWDLVGSLESSDARRANGAARLAAAPDDLARVAAADWRVQPIAGRDVVRRATVELRTPDVAAACERLLRIPNEAAGEYAHEYSISGDADRREGSLTLRIIATRLADALREIRASGPVASEHISSEDVTSAVVDLNARLTNERRIEQELLELLASRADAPLHEIAAVRKELADVRLSIERLSGARELLARQVSLATVQVFVRRPDEPAATALSLAGLLREVPAAAGRGLEAFARSLALAVQWSIGGALLWAAAGVALVVLRRRGLRRSAAERAPTP